MTPEILTLADLIKDVLLSEIRSRAKGRPIQVVSDFDGTLANTYIFSRKWNTHVPRIRGDLSEEARGLANPMCLATARTPSEAVSWVMWRKLSRMPMPLIAENGAVLVWPSDRITQPAKTEVLTSPEQSETLRRMQKELQDGLIGRLKVSTGHEVVLRPGRFATVEIRAQESTTKAGTPEDYTTLADQLQKLFPEAMSQIDIVCSGGSLGLQPKGVNKGSGIAHALDRNEVKTSDVFLVGMGDNKNDDPLFNFIRKNGGLTIGVRPSVGKACDFAFDGGG